MKVIVNLGKLNGGPHHLSRIRTGEEPTNIEDNLPSAQLFTIRVIDVHFTNIIQFLAT